MNKLFSENDINWLQNIKLKKDINFNYEILITFLNINKNIYYNVLDTISYKFSYLPKRHIIFHEYLKNCKNYIYIKKEYNDNDLYIIKKKLIYKCLDYIPAYILLNSSLLLNNKINIDDNYKKLKKEKITFIYKKLEFCFNIINDNKYNIELKIRNIKNIHDIEIIYFNNLRNIINHIPTDIHIVHKLHIHKLKGMMKQPIPLKSENDIKIDFAVTQKFDGIRSIMFINDHGKVFIIKNNLTFVIKTDLLCNLSNTIIDGELINDKIFYAIDIILYKNKYLENYDLKDRLNVLYNIKFKYECNYKYYHYKIKEYYFDNIFENSQKLIKKVYYYKINNKKYEILKDGLIFNSINEDYKKCIIYKWKQIITFDFKILKNKDHKNKFSWNLYCYSNNENYVLFPISKYNNLIVEQELDILYKDNSIIEFAFNEEQNKFYPIKVRDDKLYPNYVDVAMDNWFCLNNNIYF